MPTYHTVATNLCRYFNDLDMLVVGKMDPTFYPPPGLTQAEQQAHIALWAVLKSPMLLSCDVRSLSSDTLALLTNDHMLAIFKDPLAEQARRIRTATGSRTPSRLTFETCPRHGQAPLKRQQWRLASGKIISEDTKRVVTLTNCGYAGSGGRRNSRLVLCSDDPGAPQPPGPACRNTSCPTANAFNVSSGHLLSQPVVNTLNGRCMEGMLGPGRSSVSTNLCTAGNVKQV